MSSSFSIANFLFNKIFLRSAVVIDDLFNIRLNWAKNPHDLDEIQKLHFTISLFLAQAVPFFLLNFIFQILIDFVPMTKLAQYRFNGTKMPPVKLIVEAMLLTTFYSILAPIFIYKFGFDFIILRKNPNIMMTMNNNNIDVTDGNPTTITTTIFPSSNIIFLMQLLVCYFVTDLLFYWAHRALHEIPFCYEHIHKIHHKFIISVGWAALYAHPVEVIFGNVIPVTAACYLFNFHAVVWFTWVGLAIVGTTIAHSGFKHFSYSDVFSYFLSLLLLFAVGNGGGKGKKKTLEFYKEEDNSQVHDFHHTHQVSNFGHTLFWDGICGTDKAWKKYWSQQQKNNNQTKGDNVVEEEEKMVLKRSSRRNILDGSDDNILKKAKEIVVQHRKRSSSSSSSSSQKNNKKKQQNNHNKRTRSNSKTRRKTAK